MAIIKRFITTFFFGCKNLILYMSVVITRLTGESAMFMCPE
ncbi:hypothetical protein HMPREF9551_02119 [Escherichia coli MS 196-1]|nr:hypothetical protein HMPREF9551_02119 [Escherichia coli MS 196-1]